MELSPLNIGNGVRIGRVGPCFIMLYHIFSLLRIFSCSYSEARIIEFLLADFCGFSGQRISRGMSRIGFSPNTPHVSTELNLF